MTPGDDVAAPEALHDPSRSVAGTRSAAERWTTRARTTATVPQVFPTALLAGDTSPGADAAWPAMVPRVRESRPARELPGGHCGRSPASAPLGTWSLSATSRGGARGLSRRPSKVSTNSGSEPFCTRE
jgi:hypothetical protein